LALVAALCTRGLRERARGRGERRARVLAAHGERERDGERERGGESERDRVESGDQLVVVAVSVDLGSWAVVGASEHAGLVCSHM